MRWFRVGLLGALAICGGPLLAKEGSLCDLLAHVVDAPAIDRSVKLLRESLIADANLATTKAPAEKVEERRRAAVAARFALAQERLRLFLEKSPDRDAADWRLDPQWADAIHEAHVRFNPKTGPIDAAALAGKVRLLRGAGVPEKLRDFLLRDGVCGTDESAFLKVLRETPADETARLVFADWLEERNDPRHELIRIETELPKTRRNTRRRRELEARRAALLPTMAAAWQLPPAPTLEGRFAPLRIEPVFEFGIPTGWRIVGTPDFAGPAATRHDAREYSLALMQELMRALPANFASTQKIDFWTFLAATPVAGQTNLPYLYFYGQRISEAVVGGARQGNGNALAMLRSLRDADRAAFDQLVNAYFHYAYRTERFTGRQIIDFYEQWPSGSDDLRDELVAFMRAYGRR